jgi:hypothetical protein
MAQGPGWWLASDGKWYSPELHPDFQAGQADETGAAGDLPLPVTASPTPTSHDPVATESQVHGAHAGAVTDSLRPSRAKRRTLVAITVLAVAVVLIVVITSSSSSMKTPVSFQGPPKGSAPLAVASSVSLTRGDLPQGWTSNDQGGRCIAGNDGNPNATTCPDQDSFPGAARLDATLARCLGLPVSQLSMVTGEDEPGEPFTYSSSNFSSPASTTPGSVSTDEAAQAQSYVTVEPSASRQTSDLAALTRHTFITCQTAYFKQSVAAESAQTSPAGSTFKISHFVIRKMSVPTLPGVQIAAVTLTASFGFLTTHEMVQANEIVMGAGRIELALTLEATSKVPFPALLAKTLISREEHRLAKVAAR